MLNRWDYVGLTEPLRYGDDLTYIKAIEFLDGPGVLEDWGCGSGYARKFVKQAKYVGIDGSDSKWCTIQADLRKYISNPDYILLRHVLEHNIEWEKVLANAIESFYKRLALVIFTPFSETTHQIAWNEACGVPDISFRKEDLMEHFGRCRWREEFFRTETQYKEETIFYVEEI